MTTLTILAPLLAMAALTFFLMFGMVLTRRRAVMDKKTNPKDLLIRGGKNPWPPQAAQFSDAYQNALELPVVFYVLVIVAFATRQADAVFVALAWAFVACRAVQAYVHTTSNTRKYRSYAFRSGALVAFAMFLLLAYRLATT
ncbi:MAG: MAPEG family protein [Xanthobacteraceae bacterium]|nr:MAPEG family protein [Xanthobacteraceae bacterium]